MQKQGYHTCIIDYHIFPREKLCAGVLTAKAISLVEQIYKGIDLSDSKIRYIDRLSIFYKKEIVGNYFLDNKFGVVKRLEFDNDLLNYYIKSGGILFDGQVNYQISYKDSVAKLSSGEDIKYQFLIGADGINSRTKLLFHRARMISILCFETYTQNKLQEDSIKIFFGDMLGGYCWRIPGKNHIGIGLGELYFRGQKRSVKKYKSYFEEQGVTELADIKGAFVPTGHYVKNPVKDNVLLVGDAAGLIDAITGEGIYFAIESGRQAALSIAEYFTSGQPITKYLDRIKPIHKKMLEQRIYNKILYFPLTQKLCIAHMKKHPDFAKHIYDNVISLYTSNYTREIKRSIFNR